MISNAIKVAKHEHIVYFLLTGYLHLRCAEAPATTLPTDVKRLPLGGENDVHERARSLAAAYAIARAARRNVSALLSEALEVLCAASDRIRCLKSVEPSTASWYETRPNRTASDQTVDASPSSNE